MDLDSAPVQRDRVGPAKMLVQQHLLPRAVHEVLATDDVGDALFMILDGGLEVEQWPDLVPGTDLWPRVRIPIGVLDAQGRPIPKCRIRQVHRRSNSHHSFAGAEPPFDHLRQSALESSMGRSLQGHADFDSRYPLNASAVHLHTYAPPCSSSALACAW